MKFFKKLKFQWFFVFQNFRKNQDWEGKYKRQEEKKERGSAPALRVLRAETRLTVYRSLPYQNGRKKKEQGPPQADTLDHGNYVFKCYCFVKCV